MVFAPPRQLLFSFRAHLFTMPDWSPFTIHQERKLKDYLGVFGNHESWGDQEAFWEFFYVEFFNIHRTPLQEQRQLIEDGRRAISEDHQIVETRKQWKTRRFRVSQIGCCLFTFTCQLHPSLVQDVKNWFYTRIEESDTESEAEHEEESGGLGGEGQNSVQNAAEPEQCDPPVLGAKH